MKTCHTVIAFLFVVNCFVTTLAAGAEKPNIIFVLADDLGYTDLGCYGSKYYETPNIDKLAEQGVRMLNHHHCQNCAPTRAALMSGQYGARTGVYTVGSIDRFDWKSQSLKPVDNVTELPLDRSILPLQLKNNGYATAMFGKWHLGEKKGFFPSDRGFDEAIVSNGKHFNFTTEPKTAYPEGQYLADFLTDKAVDFISRHKGEPFFLYLPHFGVHSPFQAKKELIDYFKKKSPVGGHKDPVYAAMIKSVDESVARIMQILDELKLADNTVLIFSSDNGGVGGYEREGIREEGSDTTDNSPLRSGKGSLYEGGTRVPLIVRWPGKTTPNTTCNVPTVHVDIYPTFLELTQSKAPEHRLDGTSLVGLFKHPQSSLNREAIYQHFPGYLGASKGKFRTKPVSLIQVGNWKLMEFLEDKHIELYDLNADLSESVNLAAKNPEKALELLAKLNAWRQETNAPLPTPITEEDKTSTGKKKGDGKKKKVQ